MSSFNRQDFPAPGSPEEIEKFHKLQAKMEGIYRRVSADKNAPHTTIVIPSLSLDTEELSKVDGVAFYEERLLCMLMLLKRSRSRIVFVSSVRIHPMITQYYLNFLTGIPFGHAMRRLTMMDTADPSPKPLTQKILDSPWMMDRLHKTIVNPELAHLVVFNTSPLERTLAVRLGIPVYGADPDLLHWGSKSGCRRLFKEAGIQLPPGYEDLKTQEEIVTSLDHLWLEMPSIKKAVVKINEGFSGKGNAVFDYRPLSEYRDASPATRREKIEAALRTMSFEAKNETWPAYIKQFNKLGGIVEMFVEGEIKHSPSVQARVNSLGTPQVISTHDQIMGGPTGQMFMGCTFPAVCDYRLMIQEDGLKIAQVLATKGVLGRFAIDFIVVEKPDGSYESYAIEINLRRGGTTHPFLMMKFLIPGDYDMDSGFYKSDSGKEKYYRATDNLLDPKYVGMGPEDLIDVGVFNNLHFDEVRQRGVAFHMIGSLSPFGKLGITCIGDTAQECEELNQRTIEVLNQEATLEGRTKRLEHYQRSPQNFMEISTIM